MTATLEHSLTDLDFEHSIPCDGKRFCNPRGHPAAWWVTLRCGCQYAWCRKGLRIATLRQKARPLICRQCRAPRAAIRTVVPI